MRRAQLELRAPVSSKGWHSRGYLPHFDSPETLQFVTFRLVDSPPVEAIEKLRAAARAITAAERDAFLDAGSGACWLKRPEIAEIVEDRPSTFRWRTLSADCLDDHAQSRSCPHRAARSALARLDRQLMEAVLGPNGQSCHRAVRAILARRLLGHIHPRRATFRIHDRLYREQSRQSRAHRQPCGMAVEPSPASCVRDEDMSATGVARSNDQAARRAAILSRDSRPLIGPSAASVRSLRSRRFATRRTASWSTASMRDTISS